jgi:hypothetical protein
MAFGLMLNKPCMKIIHSSVLKVVAKVETICSRVVYIKTSMFWFLLRFKVILLGIQSHFEIIFDGRLF